MRKASGLALRMSHPLDLHDAARQDLDQSLVELFAGPERCLGAFAFDDVTFELLVDDRQLVNALLCASFELEVGAQELLVGALR